MAHHNASAPGFLGNDNLYGIGIRIGYYTQAVSIGIANFYAQHEAPYLHNVTILFLAALFVGICVLSANPKEAYAVEPFMLACVAYYTIYMGLWDQSPPYLLPWEPQFKNRITVDVIWMAFHSYDLWYWWYGIYLMKPSNGPDGTVIFYPYIGQVQLYGWITIAARVINAIVLLVSILCIVSLSGYAWQQARMDEAISAQRLKALTERWFKGIGNHFSQSRLDVSITSPTESSCLFTSNDSYRDVSNSPTKKPSSRRPSSTMSKAAGCHDVNGSKQDLKAVEKEQMDPELTREPTGPPSYCRPTRTGTSLLKRRILGLSNNTDIDLSQPSPEYFAYEPTFQNIRIATELLKAATASKEGKKSCFRPDNILKTMLRLPYWWLQVYIYIFTQFFHPFRPAVLFAVAGHAHQLGFGKHVSYPQCLISALRHPTYRNIQNSADVVLASRILITLDPPPKAPRWALIMTAWGIFGGCSVLAIGTELTIQWNGIHGVQDIKSVGQLIPFCLGVGGLFKVIYSAVTERVRRHEERYCYFGRCTSTHRMKEWKEAADGYKKCLGAWERSLVLPVLGKEKVTA